VQHFSVMGYKCHKQIQIGRVSELWIQKIYLFSPSQMSFESHDGRN
jgi:hypothetical protein